jgi:hypothetical protein
MDWLWQNLLSNWVWEVLMLAVGLLFAWLRHKNVQWLPVLVYGLTGCALTGVIGYTLTGRAILSQRAPVTTLENIEPNIRKWCDTFGLSVQTLPVTNAHFSVGIIIPMNGRKIMVARLKERDRYLQLQAEITANKEQQATMGKFSVEQNQRTNHEVNLELARSKLGFLIAGSGMDSPIRGVVLTKTIPITENLSEAVFMSNIDEMDSGIALADEAVSFAIQHNDQTRLRPGRSQ